MAVPKFYQPRKARKPNRKESEKQRQKKTGIGPALTDFEQH
jgi:hypothetical protein